MWTYILTSIALSGPLMDNDYKKIDLIIHVQPETSFKTKVIRSELRNQSAIFIVARYNIEQRFRIVIREDAYSEPEYQFGRNDIKQKFKPGTFACNYSFIRTLKYVSDIAYIDFMDPTESKKYHHWGWKKEERYIYEYNVMLPYEEIFKPIEFPSDVHKSSK